MFLKDRQVSSFGCFPFEFSALFSKFGWFVVQSVFETTMSVER